MEKEFASITDELIFLPLPENGESVNIRILAPPEYLDINNSNFKDCKIIAVRIQVLGIKEHFWLHINSTIYKGMLAEFGKAKIHVDPDLKCMVGCIFTIAGRIWEKAPKELWKPDGKGELLPPKTYAIALRKDIMDRDYEQML